MRIGVFYGDSYYLRYYETALKALIARGHTLVLARTLNQRPDPPPPYLRDHPSVELTRYPKQREDGLEETVKAIRALRDFVRYDRPALRSSEAARQRAFDKLARSISKPEHLYGAEHPPAAGLSERQLDTLDQVFEDIEGLIPPNPPLVSFIEERRLDALVSVTRVKTGQNDIVKAAQAAGVPAGVIVYSWDNLSSKGMIHVQPDRLFVWNAVQAREAEELHGVDPARVFVAGAPRFDPFFEQEPSASREELLAELGLDPAKRTLLYLGSSTFVAPREPEFVDAWLGAVVELDANVIVRPHPGSMKEGLPWPAWQPPEGVALTAGTRRSRHQDLYDQLFASDAVVGLNTSAEIEAAILGKPVFTVSAGELAPGQEGSLHFRYLLAGESGWVTHDETLDEHVAHVRETLAGDTRAEERRRALEAFIRPAGIEKPAGPVLAESIEELAALDRPAVRAEV